MTVKIQINHSLQYIESHLTEPACIADTAAAAGYSRHHFSRTFLALTGLTPTSYLRKRRLSEAARELVTSPKRILDIALDYQFGSQEAFTRSFRREFGINSGGYRQRGRLHQLWGAISLGFSDLLYPGQGISPSPKLIIPERKIVEAVIRPWPQIDQMNAINGEIANPSGAADGSVSIRSAHRQDIPALCQLYYELHEFTTRGVPQRLHSWEDYECFDAASLSLSLHKRIDSLSVAIWVAEKNGQVIGLAEVYLREDAPSKIMAACRYGYLQSLVVKQSWRGRGIGSKLLKAAEDWSRQQGAAELRMETWEFEKGHELFMSNIDTVRCSGR